MPPNKTDNIDLCVNIVSKIVDNYYIVVKVEAYEYLYFFTERMGA
jgi:hypothetical protein